MKKIEIFCEGVTDQLFIADCIEYFYNLKFIRKEIIKSKFKIYSDQVEIIDVGGCSNLANPIYISKLEDNTKGENIVIFDADEFGIGNNGFESCVDKLEQLKTRNKVALTYYIWPNNSDDGNIENLLRKLIPSKKESLFLCIDNHVNCLTSLPFACHIPPLKEKINAYLHLNQEKSSLNNRDYKREDIWDLDYQNLPDLSNFKSFLDSFFIS